MSARPSTAEYQRARKATLRGIEREHILANARKLARENQRNGHSYKRRMLRALKPRAA